MLDLKLTVVIGLIAMAGFSSANAQSKAKVKPSKIAIPPFLKEEHARASKGDAMAMLRENKKRQMVGLEKKYSDKLIEKKLSAAAHSGNAKAMLELAKFRLERLEVRTTASKEPLKELIRRAAMTEDPEAMAEWALWLSRESGAKRSSNEIEHWFYKAWDLYESKAKQGDVSAMMALVRIRIPQTFPTTRVGNQMSWGDRQWAWFKEAAKKGDPDAAFAMGMEIFSGSPLVSHDGPRSSCEQYFLRSAKAGNWKAMLQLATIYGHGGVKKLDGGAYASDAEKAWYWLDKAIEATGNPNIGFVYFDDEGIDDESFMFGFPPRPASVPRKK